MGLLLVNINISTYIVWELECTNFDYLNNNIHPDIHSVAFNCTMGNWAIWSIPTFTSVTNNQAKEINFVLKQLQDWKEAPVDCI